MIDEVRYCDKSKELLELGFRPSMCLNNDNAYRDVFGVKLNVPACQLFLINPRFLDYYGFMGNTNYGCNIAYIYDKYLDDFNNLKNEMKEYYGFNVFVKLGG